MSCCIVNCGNRRIRDLVNFYRIPRELSFAHRVDLNELSKRRRQKWLQAIRRENLTEVKLKYYRVCSKHFVSGKPSELKDEDNPDWVPSLAMGYGNEVVNKKAHIASTKEERAKKRKQMLEDMSVYSVDTATKSRKLSRQGAIPSRKLPLQGDRVSSRTKTGSKIVKRSKKSNNDQNDGTDSQINGNNDHISVAPQVHEFEIDNKFEVFYLDPEKEKTCTRKLSVSDSETDEADESHGIDFDKNNFQEMDQVPLDSQRQKSEQVSSDNHRLCRICLTSVNLTYLTKCQSLVALFVNITNIEVDTENNLPKYICAECIQKLEEISNFVCMAKKNDEKLKRTMLVNKEAKIESSRDDDEETLSVDENESIMYQEVFSDDIVNNRSGTMELSAEIGEKPFRSEITVLNSVDLPGEESKILKSKGGLNDIDNNRDASLGNRGPILCVPFGKDCLSEEKIDCVCRKCGVLLVGIRVPEALVGIPTHKMKFRCLSCSKPEKSSNKTPTTVKKKSSSFEVGDLPRVYPGKSSSEDENKIRCIICSENFPLGEFVTHQLQQHSINKNHTCSICFSSFSSPDLLKWHAKRHT